MTFFTSLSHRQFVRVGLESKCILDVAHPLQMGLTMRAIEAIGLGTKLATTSKDVVNYDFYDPRNIRVIDTENIVLDSEFLDTTYSPPPKHIVERYSLATWIRDVIDGGRRARVGTSLGQRNVRLNRVSVCMATYNGEQYVGKQIGSIMAQLGADDEVIVVDDCSTDDTVEILRNIRDTRIRIVVNDINRREVFSFGKAISLANNEYIFLADQDDIWIPGRVDLMKECLSCNDRLLASSNFDWVNSNEEPIDVEFDGVNSLNSNAWVRNIADIFAGKTNYFGCAMAFRRELIPIILPIPDYVESHDLWIALAGNLLKANVHLDDKTLWKRKHDSNTTSTVSNRSLYMKIRARAIFALSIMELLRREKTVDASFSSSIS